LQEFLGLIGDSEQIIRVGGLVLLTLVVYAETGIFFCFFLPGDYLLFLAGVFCATGLLPVSLPMLVGCLFGAATLGNYTGYLFGKFLGHTLENRRDTFFFKKSYLNSTRATFDKYGGAALVVARFLPIVRTFAPILAGMAKMKWTGFWLFNLIGATLWVALLTVTGFYLGTKFPGIVNYVHYIILGFASITGFTVLSGFLRMRRNGRNAAIKAQSQQVNQANQPL
jgi:membrane-associated protein